MNRSKKDADPPKKRRPPATTIEGRENQLISEAMDMAEEQILNRTATSQTLTYFLKLGGTREKLEKERLIEENKLLRAKTENLKSQQNMEAMFKEALSALTTYQGGKKSEDYND